MKAYKILELIFSYLLATAIFGTFTWLVAEKGFQWTWLCVGMFFSFLVLGFTKVEVMKFEDPKK